MNSFGIRFCESKKEGVRCQKKFGHEKGRGWKGRRHQATKGSIRYAWEV